MVLPNFKENLEKYAKLLVANGINVQPGHTVALSIDVEQAELAHLLVKESSQAVETKRISKEALAPKELKEE